MSPDRIAIKANEPARPYYRSEQVCAHGSIGQRHTQSSATPQDANDKGEMQGWPKVEQDDVQSKKVRRGTEQYTE